jgi:hypothetical protein
MPTLMLVKDVSDHQLLTPFKRRSEPRPRRSDYNRRRFLGWLRDEVAVLHALGMDYRRIAAQLDIEKHDVRAFSPKLKGKILRHNLSQRALHDRRFRPFYRGYARSDRQSARGKSVRR